MRCPHCQTDNLEGSLICANCGSSLNQSTCPNGHAVDPSWDRCPYCQALLTPTAGGGRGFIEGSGTMAGASRSGTAPMGYSGISKGQTVADSTAGFNQASSGMSQKRRTMIESDQGFEKSATEVESSFSQSRKKRTVIIPGESSDSEDKKAGKSPSAPKPRLVGWLVSFTFDPSGRDYRIREGRNTVGSDPAMDLVLTEDQTISGHNSTIMWRGSKVFIRDEMSMNGTFVNGADILDTMKEIHDGDKIKLGKMDFILKTI